MEMGLRIRDYIESKGIRFTYVAERAGMDKRKLSRLLSGHQKITTDEYEKICVNALELPPGYFFSNNVLDTKKKSA